MTTFIYMNHRIKNKRPFKPIRVMSETGVVDCDEVRLNGPSRVLWGQLENAEHDVKAWIETDSPVDCQ